MDHIQHLIILGIIGFIGFPGLSWAAEPLPEEVKASEASTLSCDSDNVVTNLRSEAGLSLTQAPGGVVGDKVVIMGKIESSGVTGLLVLAQHDRSKSIIPVNTAGALKPDGQFEFSVPLSQFGSYTISIQAMRVGGNPLVISARVSRVLAPHDLGDSTVMVSEVAAGEALVSIDVDLEKSCREAAKTGLPRDCDLIGSQTGATTITAVNRTSFGKEIIRKTNLGVEGKYQLCMPLGDGDNTITVSVNNAALSGDVVLATRTVSFSKKEPTVRWINSDHTQLKFAIDDWAPKKTEVATCEGGVQIEWNRERAWDTVSGKMDFRRLLCPVNGVYAIASLPVSGVNELSIHLPGESGREFHYSFGWGKAVWAKDLAKGVAAVHLDHAMLDRQLPGIINRFLESDQFPKLIASLFSGVAPSGSMPASPEKLAEIAEIRKGIPKCGAKKEGSVRTEVVGQPSVAAARLDAVTLSENKIQMDMNFEHLVIPLKIFKDANDDGQPDKGFLPLKIAFKKLRLRPIVVVQQNRVQLTAEKEDCTFKPETYCKHQPAIFQPSDMVGEATQGGAIVACDSAGQMGAADLDEKCTSLDIVNMQTGQLSEKILDTLNETLYCDVSAQLTYALRHGHHKVERDFTVMGRNFSWASELALDEGGLAIRPEGIDISVGSTISGGGFYYAAPGQGHAPKGRALGMMLREDLINQALAAWVNLGEPGSGLLDWTLDAQHFFDIDFNTQCNVPAGQKPGVFCLLEPTVEKWLGTALAEANYYAKNDPLRITVRADRVLAPHLRLRVTEAGEMVADIDIPNLELAFAAIQGDSDRPIISVRLTILLSLTLDKIATYAEDPSQLAFTVRLRRDETRVAIMPVPKSNQTLLPDHVLVRQLRDFISLAMDTAAKPEMQIPPIRMDKKLPLPSNFLGLSEIQFGEGELQLTVNPLAHAFTLGADPILLQRLLIDDLMQEFRWGE